MSVWENRKFKRNVENYVREIQRTQITNQEYTEKMLETFQESHQELREEIAQLRQALTGLSAQVVTEDSFQKTIQQQQEEMLKAFQANVQDCTGEISKLKKLCAELSACMVKEYEFQNALKKQQKEILDTIREICQKQYQRIESQYGHLEELIQLHLINELAGDVSDKG